MYLYNKVIIVFLILSDCEMVPFSGFSQLDFEYMTSEKFFEKRESILWDPKSSISYQAQDWHMSWSKKEIFHQQFSTDIIIRRRLIGYNSHLVCYCENDNDATDRAYKKVIRSANI